MLAKIILSCGRLHLMVGDFALATQGDVCRTEVPIELLEPIPQAELDTATIGGKPIKDMPRDLISVFRKEYWNEKMLHYVKDEINKSVEKLIAEKK